MNSSDTAAADGGNSIRREAKRFFPRRSVVTCLGAPVKSRHIHPQQVTKIVSDLAAEDAIVTCDVGTPVAWTARYFKVNGRRRIVGSFSHGSMANALLQAIEAQCACPDRQVISMPASTVHRLSGGADPSC